jgi:O-methyltransferase involved in polyketide biosynthesis
MDADLTLQDLSDVLESAGFDRNQRAFILWEGLTHYLGEVAVDSTLRTLARTATPGSRLLLTYFHGGLIDGTVEFDAHDSPVSRSGATASRGSGGWTRRACGCLAGRGMELLEDLGADEYGGRYWGGRGRRMRGFALYRVALAQVKNPQPEE